MTTPGGDADHEAEPLAGGNMGVVTRIGSSVARPSGPWTPSVQQFMSELRSAGLATVPEPRGLADDGRELIEYIEGDVGTYPMPSWVWSDAVLMDVAHQLRVVHDAAAHLSIAHGVWRRPPLEPVETICHGDVAPYNTVCVDGRVRAFIDWDFARPAPRGWDLGYAAYRWISLMQPGGSESFPMDVAEQRRRLALFCDAYGDGFTPDEVVEWAIIRLDDLIAYSRAEAAAGNAAFASTIEQGHVAFYEREVAWLRATHQPANM